MYISTKWVQNDSWQELEEVNTQEAFLIQNISDFNIRYCVLDSKPSESISGGIITPYQQLSFKKTSGNMYIKKDNSSAQIVIEKVES